VDACPLWVSGRGLCDVPITCPEESYRLWCVIKCDPVHLFPFALVVMAGRRGLTKNINLFRLTRSQVSSVGMVAMPRVGLPRKRDWLCSRDKTYPFFRTSKSTLGPTHPPIQWIRVTYSPEIKQPVREANCSLNLLPWLRLSGAIPPFSHMTLERPQGQIYFTCALLRATEWRRLCSGGATPTVLYLLYLMKCPMSFSVPFVLEDKFTGTHWIGGLVSPFDPV
jgi:hypothetical protein